MPSSGTLTGRTLAYRSSSRRSVTFALSMLPPLGVVVGPFRRTSQVRMACRHSSGTAWPQARRFSMVRPSMGTRLVLPAAISSFSRHSSTRTACFMMMGPMPSPGTMPMRIVASSAKFLLPVPASMASCLRSWARSSSSKCAVALLIISSTALHPQACHSLPGVPGMDQHRLLRSVRVVPEKGFVDGLVLLQ